MRTFLIVGALVFFTLLPIVSFAWVPGEPIVPSCNADPEGDGPFCQACDLMRLANNLIAFAVYFSAFIATVMFAYAGFLYVTAASNQENLNKAKKIFSSVLFGFVVVLVAWLVIDLVLSTFTGKDFGFWTDVKCEEFTQLSDATPTTVGVGSSAKRCTGEECYQNSAEVLAALKGTNVGVSSTGGCDDPSRPNCTGLAGMQKDTIQDTIALCGNLKESCTISGGTEIGHSNTCHISGTCNDITFDQSFIGTSGQYNADNINKVITESKKLGRCPVFEPAGGGACPSGVTQCERVSRSTGDHFSFYECK